MCIRDSYYTVNQISNMLNIHPKTIQRYIREGKLRAAKVGKGWRVTGHDLSVFIENGSYQEPASERQTERRIIASSVIDINVYGKEDAIRIMNTLVASMNSKPVSYTHLDVYKRQEENKVGILFFYYMGDDKIFIQ